MVRLYISKAVRRSMVIFLSLLMIFSPVTAAGESVFAVSSDQDLQANSVEAASEDPQQSEENLEPMVAEGLLWEINPETGFFESNEIVDYNVLNNDQLGVGLQHLLTGFNVLSGEDIANEGRESLNRNLLAHNHGLNQGLNVSVSSMTGTSNAHVGRTIHELARSTGIDISVSQHRGVTLGQLFRLSASRRFQAAATSSVRSLNNTFFYTHRVEQGFGTNQINIESDAVRQLVINGLDETFLRRLKGLEDGWRGAEGAKRVFEVYGSHFVTRYSLGGVFEHSITTVIDERSQEATVSTYLQGRFEAAVENFANVSSSFELARHFQTSAHRHHFSSSFYTTTAGGQLVVPTDPDDSAAVALAINTWLNNLTPQNSMIQIDNNLEFAGIWSLLPDGHEDRFYELARVFHEESMRLEREFFDDFIYLEHLPDDTGGVTVVSDVHITTHGRLDRANVGSIEMPAGAIPISSLADFNRELRRGAATAGNYYYLTTDIVLPDPWEPIRDFRGTLDGQGFTISNLVVRPGSPQMDNNNRRRKGLFWSISSGHATIRNLRVRLGSGGIHAGISGGSIQVVYAGGLIAEVAAGASVTIENTSVQGGTIRASISNSGTTTSLTFTGASEGDVRLGNFSTSSAGLPANQRRFTNATFDGSSVDSGTLLFTVG